MQEARKRFDKASLLYDQVMFHTNSPFLLLQVVSSAFCPDTLLGLRVGIEYFEL